MIAIEIAMLLSLAIFSAAWRVRTASQEQESINFYTSMFIYLIVGFIMLIIHFFDIANAIDKRFMTTFNVAQDNVEKHGNSYRIRIFLMFALLYFSIRMLFLLSGKKPSKLPIFIEVAVVSIISFTLAFPYTLGLVAAILFVAGHFFICTAMMYISSLISVRLGCVLVGINISFFYYQLTRGLDFNIFSLVGLVEFLPAYSAELSHTIIIASSIVGALDFFSSLKSGDWSL